MRIGQSRGVTIRSRALQRLAQFYTSSGSGNSRNENLNLLVRLLPISYSSDLTKLYTIPLTINEWEILLALSNVELKTVQEAERLLNDVIAIYFLGSPRQRVSEVLYARFKLNRWKNPNEIITYQLTKYIIKVCHQFPELLGECCSLVDNYLQTVKKVSLVKQSALFSLMGFLNCFIDGSSSFVLTEHIWTKIVSEFYEDGFFDRMDHILTSPNSYTNEAIVHYFDTGNEISKPLMMYYLTKIQTTMVTQILNIPFDKDSKSMTEYLLDRQLQMYQHDQSIKDNDTLESSSLSTSTEENCKPDFIFKINKNRTLLSKLCRFSINLFLDLEKNLDSLSSNRARFSFDSLANLLSILALIPFFENYEEKLFNDLTNIISQSLDKYLLSEMISESFLKTIITTGSLLNFYTEKLSEKFLRNFPILVGSEYMDNHLVIEISKMFAIGLKPLNEDSIVSTIYAINNLLTLTEDANPNALRERQLTLTSLSSTTALDMFSKNETMKKTGSYASLLKVKQTNSTPTPSNIHINLFKNCIATTVKIAIEYNSPTIMALTISILSQKSVVVSQEFNMIIFEAFADMACYTPSSEFIAIIKFFKVVSNTALKNNDMQLFNSVIQARTILSQQLITNKLNTEVYRLQLNDILDSIIATGEVENLEHHRPHTEISHIAEQIASQLGILAALLPKMEDNPIDISKDEILTTKFRNIWFNMAVHGYYMESEIVKGNYDYLMIIAHNSPPLASDFPVNNKEMSLEMNTVLRRGSSNSIVKQQKQVVFSYLNLNAVQARSMSTSKIMFIAATVLIETIRCETGTCYKILHYLSGPAMASSSIDKSIVSIANSIVTKYVAMAKSKTSVLFNSKTIAKQLNELLLCLVSRNTMLQEAAFTCCRIFIEYIPSALCHHNSLFTLLDLMSAIFESILDCEANRYQPRFEFSLKHSNVKILLPASAEWRAITLKKLHHSAKDWVKYILNKADEDTKILLQSYISDVDQTKRLNSVEFGVSFAMEMAGLIISSDKELSNIMYSGPAKPNTISGFLSQHSWRSKYLVDTAIASSSDDFVKSLEIIARDIRHKISLSQPVSAKSVTDFLDMGAALLILGKYNASSLLFDIVHLPFEVFTSAALKIATNVWLTIIKERADLAHILLADVCYCWMRTIDDNMGLYSTKNDFIPEENQKMEYSPYNKAAIDKSAKAASKDFAPHRCVLKFFASHFEGTLLQSKYLLKVFTKTILYSIQSFGNASLHPFARMIRFEMLQLATTILAHNINQKTSYVQKLAHAIIDGSLTWFKKPSAWSFGSNNLKIKTDLSILNGFFKQLITYAKIFKKYCGSDFTLLQYFIVHEIQQIETWLSPLLKIKGANSNHLTEDVVLHAFNKDAYLASNIVERYRSKKLEQYLAMLVVKDPLSCVHVSDLLSFYIDGLKTSKVEMHTILYWVPTSPLKAINLFAPNLMKNPYILQYSMFALESHDVNVTFFYVPQIVQCLRYDRTGYVEKLIIDTAKISVLFSHQIIWNMLANCYKGDEGLIEDEIKPILDRVREKMIKGFSQSHLEFYEKEFGFFNDVTNISGKLKPYIKKSKAEKKQKIDEEMAKIVVKPNVYLPSNPDGVIIDINRTSGKPLQSHAKAPFMASFKIRKEERDAETGELVTVEKWQAAIFKVGDDCRQDLLALQLISIFKTIWANIGLDLYVFPYRVTATAPGCGVIDVLPNSISRDMLGREAVNGLYEYFISKFGPESSIEFQKARSNLVKSLAGYSVISYLLQFKDRHNGNIMYDDQGHCLHIDFGFIFDIVPGGVKFEAVPFKLTKEMVKVMGGSNLTPAFEDFEELCIKAYLSVRPHMNFIIESIKPMLDSGLPCFKGKTISNLKDRFQPDKTDHEAALYMKGLIKKSFESVFTVGYDEFQRITNGIPY